MVSTCIEYLSGLVLGFVGVHVFSFVFLAPHVIMSCATLVCVLCSDWFFDSCVMFSLVVLVMCLVSHWLICVM